MDAVAKMNYGKTTGLNDVRVEMVKKGGNAVIDWLVRLCHVC